MTDEITLIYTRDGKEQKKLEGFGFRSFRINIDDTFMPNVVSNFEIIAVTDQTAERYNLDDIKLTYMNPLTKNVITYTKYYKHGTKLCGYYVKDRTFHGLDYIFTLPKKDLVFDKLYVRIKYYCTNQFNYHNELLDVSEE